MDYNFNDIEKKWQKKWVDNKTYKVVEDADKKKFYVLNMFPYRFWSRASCWASSRLYSERHLRSL